MIEVRRILVPLDHSPGLEAVVDLAIVVARGLRASLSLLHVYEPPNELVGLVPGASVADEAAAEREAGAALLERASTQIEAAGAGPVDRILERDTRAAGAIVRHARAGHYDLIVMGTHARKGVARLVLGSTAEHVLRDAPCPVLTIHLPHE